MLAANTQPIPKVDRREAITAPIPRVQRRPERESVHALDVLVYGRYAHVTGNVPLRTKDGNPVEYRLLIAEGRDGAPISSDLPQRVAGAGSDGDRSLLAPTRVGRVTRSAPFHSLDIVISGADLDPLGWLDLGAAVDRRVARDVRFDGVSRGQLEWIPDGALVTIDIGNLERGVEWLVLRFEAREVLDAATSASRPLHHSGRTVIVHTDARTSATGDGSLFPLDGAWRF